MALAAYAKPGGDISGTSQINPVPLNPYVYLNKLILNGSSADMCVDGSSTPVNFDYSPGTDETWYLERISFLIDDLGNMDASKFGFLSELTNGLVIKIKTNGTEYTVATLKNNMDVVMMFPIGDGHHSSGGNFLGSVNAYSGVMTFNEPMTLKDSTSDYIRFTVNDDLEGLEQHRALAHVWRVP